MDKTIYHLYIDVLKNQFEFKWENGKLKYTKEGRKYINHDFYKNLLKYFIKGEHS